MPFSSCLAYLPTSRLACVACGVRVAARAIIGSTGSMKHQHRVEGDAERIRSGVFPNEKNQKIRKCSVNNFPTAVLLLLLLQLLLAGVAVCSLSGLFFLPSLVGWLLSWLQREIAQTKNNTQHILLAKHESIPRRQQQKITPKLKTGREKTQIYFKNPSNQAPITSHATLQ